MMVVQPSRFTPPAGGSSIARRASGSTAGTTGTVTFVPAGALEGDFVFVELAMYNTSSFGISGGSGSAWTYLSVGSTRLNVAYKQLQAGDVGATFTVARTTPAYAAVAWVAYSGVTSVTYIGGGNNLSATPYSVAGFSAAPGAVVLSFYKADDDADAALTPPSGFVEVTDLDIVNVGVEVGIAEDFDYAGQAMAWASSGSTIDRNAQMVLQLT